MAEKRTVSEALEQAARELEAEVKRAVEYIESNIVPKARRDEEVAAFFGVSTRTVERRRRVERFREVMERARAKGRVSVRRNLFRLASNGNVAAAIFLAKNLLGYRDVIANEHSGPDGRAISIDSRPELSHLTEEELEQLQAFIDKTHPNRAS